MTFLSELKDDKMPFSGATFRLNLTQEQHHQTAVHNVSFQACMLVLCECVEEPGAV